MDIAAYSVQNSLNQVQEQASLAVMKQSMDNADIAAEGLAKLLSGAAEIIQDPALGKNIDLSV